MKIVFEDESAFEIDRLNKMHDVVGSEIRLMIDLSSVVDVDDVFEKDFSSFTLKRTGFADIEFEGYEINDVSELFERRSTLVTVNLAKEAQSL